MTCDRNSMLTRATEDCKPWDDVSLDFCMKKCSGYKSAAPSLNCPNEDCKFLIYDAKERICHLADKTCTLTNTTGAMVVYKRKEGQYISALDYLSCIPMQMFIESIVILYTTNSQCQNLLSAVCSNQGQGDTKISSSFLRSYFHCVRKCFEDFQRSAPSGYTEL